MEARRCKGMRDLLPEDMVRFRRIESVFGSCCSRWGYREVRTPLIEYLHLFTSAGTLTSDMLSRVYSFLDWDGWSGERVVLRPDGTIPAARLYVDNFKQGSPAKLFYVENTFIFDETGKESRERWQCGAELIGVSRPEADAELVLLAVDVLDQLGCGAVQLKLSHAGVLMGLFESIGLEQGKQLEMLDRVLNGDTGVLEEVIASQPQLGDFLVHMLGSKGGTAGFLKNVRASAVEILPALESSLDDFVSIAELLDAAGCDYEIDLSSARGFEYYTGVIFQLDVGGWKVGGGGRYDALIPLVGGGDVPASGFALYLEQLMEAVGPEGLEQAAEYKILVRSEGNTPRDYRSCLDIAGSLRQRGYVAELDLGYQELSGYRWILVVPRGEEEVAPLLLTDCSTGRDTSLTSLSDVLEVLEEAKCG